MHPIIQVRGFAIAPPRRWMLEHESCPLSQSFVLALLIAVAAEATNSNAASPTH
jgi:hypothetical protein